MDFLKAIRQLVSYPEYVRLLTKDQQKLVQRQYSIARRQRVNLHPLDATRHVVDGCSVRSVQEKGRTFWDLSGIIHHLTPTPAILWPEIRGDFLERLFLQGLGSEAAPWCETAKAKGNYSTLITARGLREVYDSLEEEPTPFPLDMPWFEQLLALVES